jgi:hypothetical protein
VLLVALWRLRYQLILHDLAEMFVSCGFVFTHEAIRDREARFAPLLSGHAVLAHCLRESNDTVLLDKPAENDLRLVFSMARPDIANDFVANHFTIRHRIIGGDSHAGSARRTEHDRLVEIRMIFDLVVNERRFA